MKSLVCTIIIAALIFSIFAPFAVAQAIPNYSDKYVDDFAGIFSQNETAYLRNLLYETEINTTAEAVVATIKECGEDYTSFAFNLASTWKIGKADKSNGLLILYCGKLQKVVIFWSIV